MTGSRGPLPKPTALKLLEGNAGKRALDLSAGVNPRIEVPTAPRHLCPAGKKEWTRITPLLADLGLISGLDLAALALYCNAYGRLVDLETNFNEQVNLLVDGGMKYHDAVYQASHSVTPSGYAQQSVAVQLIKNHREQVNRYLMHFGLSPAARGRVQPSNFVQPDLPGMPAAPNTQQTLQAAAGFGRFAPQLVQ